MFGAREVTSRVVLGCVVNQTADKPYYLFDGYAHLAAGLACGLAGLAAGMAIGIVGDAGVRYMPQPLPVLQLASVGRYSVVPPDVECQV